MLLSLGLVLRRLLILLPGALLLAADWLRPLPPLRLLAPTQKFAPQEVRKLGGILR